MDNIIEVNNLTYEYCSDDAEPVTVLKDFDLNITRGSFTVILGHNGSGKSTLAKLLNGLYKPTKGSVKVNGMLTTDDSLELKIKQTVGLVFQNPDNQLVASVVEEDVAFGPENLGVAPNEIRKRVDDALMAVDMYEHRLSAPHKLSGGQKQRVAIAGIIAMNPECIVFDEPTAMLDPKGRAEVINTILKLNREKGITVVLITHFMNEAEQADRVIVMNDGKIADDGNPAEIFSKVDFLRSCGLDIPQTTELLDELSSAGIHVSRGIISIEDTARELLSILQSEEN